MKIKINKNTNYKVIDYINNITYIDYANTDLTIIYNKNECKINIIFLNKPIYERKYITNYQNDLNDLKQWLKDIADGDDININIITKNKKYSERFLNILNIYYGKNYKSIKDITWLNKYIDKHNLDIRSNFKRYGPASKEERNLKRTIYHLYYYNK